MHRDISLVERLNNESPSPKTGCFPSSMVSGSGLVIVKTFDKSAYPSEITQEVACSKCPLRSVMLNRAGISASSSSSTVKQSDTSTRQHDCVPFKRISQHHSNSMPHSMPVLPRIRPATALHSLYPAHYIGQEVTA